MGKQFKGTAKKWNVNSANKFEINSFDGVAIADCSMSIIANNEEDYKKYNLNDLLPNSFGPENLIKEEEKDV